MNEFLTCNAVVSDVATVGNYLIEWRLGSENGPVVFISGKGSDPLIQREHPFQNEIVLSGTLYPVLKYIEFDSTLYTLENGVIGRYSPDLLTCLAYPPIVVDALGCGVVNYSGKYDYVLTREVNIGSKSREIKYNIGETTQFLAWAFDTVNIPDQIELFYCTENDLEGEIMDSIILGIGVTNNYTPSNYPRQPGYNPSLPVTPIVTNNNGFSTTGILKYVSDLRPFNYQPGDFIRIKITGNIYEPNSDGTKWTLYLKCLDSIPPVYDYSNVGIINSPVSFIWNGEECRYELTYTTEDVWDGNIDATNSLETKYMSAISRNNNQAFNTTLGGSSYLLYEISLVSGFNGTGCSTAAGEITGTKLSNGILLSFTEVEDYNLAVDEIQAVKDHILYTDYYENSTPQDGSYYSYYILPIFDTGISCDNPGTNRTMYVHLSSEITYDSTSEIKTIFFAFPTTAITNEIPSIEDCNDVYSTVQSTVSLLNSTISQANGVSYTSSLKGSRIVGYRIFRENIYSQTFMDPRSTKSIYKIMVNNIVDLTDYGYIEVGNEYLMQQVEDKITITDPSTPTSRLNSWKLERRKSIRTKVSSDYSTYELIAEA